MNDNELFRQQMQDVKRLKVTPKVALKSQRVTDDALRQRRAAAQAITEQDTNFLSADYIHPVAPLDILDFRRHGVQHGVYKNLRLGKYSIDARLDLHRLTVEQARAALFQFVRDCLEHDIRCALITHGKGEGREQPALLKSCVASWLPCIDEVLAFHSAQKHHGASGATYLLLKKSKKKSHENWEHHAKRR